MKYYDPIQECNTTGPRRMRRRCPRTTDILPDTLITEYSQHILNESITRIRRTNNILLQLPYVWYIFIKIHTFIISCAQRDRFVKLNHVYINIYSQFQILAVHTPAVGMSFNIVNTRTVKVCFPSHYTGTSSVMLLKKTGDVFWKRFSFAIWRDVKISEYCYLVDEAMDK